MKNNDTNEDSDKYIKYQLLLMHNKTNEMIKLISILAKKVLALQYKDTYHAKNIILNNDVEIKTIDGNLIFCPIKKEVKAESEKPVIEETEEDKTETVEETAEETAETKDEPTKETEEDKTAEEPAEEPVEEPVEEPTKETEEDKTAEETTETKDEAVEETTETKDEAPEKKKISDEHFDLILYIYLRNFLKNSKRFW